MLAALWSRQRSAFERTGAGGSAQIAAALALAVVYSAWNASDNAESNAVERFHFLEYGLITWLFYRAWRPLDDLAIFLLPTLAGIIVGTAEEWLQWFIPNRVGELRDIFLNLAAIVCGLLFSAGVDPPPRFEATLRPSSSARVLRLAAVTVLALAAFFHSVHLGYEIADPEIGSFTSRYAPEQLPALQGTVAERWKTQPPPLVLHRISREDQYLERGARARALAQPAMGGGRLRRSLERESDPGEVLRSCTRHTDVRREAGAPVAGRAPHRCRDAFRNCSAPERLHQRRLPVPRVHVVKGALLGRCGGPDARPDGAQHQEST